MTKRAVYSPDLTPHLREYYLNLNDLTNKSVYNKISPRTEKTISGKDNGFSGMGISKILLKAIDRLNFNQPTPVQRESIPVGIRGVDILAMARTGSGKTLAFGIPMLQRLSCIKEGRGLVLVPTRELAIQVEEAIQAIGRPLNMRSVVLIGGASMDAQRVALKKNPEIVIATPGRLMDHIDRRTVNLSNVEVLVLDEADRMLDMGFARDIKKIMKSVPPKRQTMLFSATMPKEIETLANSLLDNPTRIETDQSGMTPQEVSHEMFLIPNQTKSRLLAFQLQQFLGPVLVFTKTKRMASKLAAKVNGMGFSAAEIHSNRSLGQRRHALDGFKRGQYKILIATDIAARGIDVSGIELVVNYDMPATSEDYVHRIGRTGRAGKSGHAISFVTSEQRGSIRSLEKFMNTELSFSALPALPSERVILKEAAQLAARLQGETTTKAATKVSNRVRKSRPQQSQPSGTGSKISYSSNFKRKQRPSKRRKTSPR